MINQSSGKYLVRRSVTIELAGIGLKGELTLPKGCMDVVLLADGSGSSRFSPGNRLLATRLNEEKIGTLLFDLLSVREERIPEKRFDIELLAGRLLAVTKWLLKQETCSRCRVGFFGVGTGAAAALQAAALFPSTKGVVCLSGRTDLAAGWISKVKCPVLLLVGSRDSEGLRVNRLTKEALRGEKKLIQVNGTGHFFSEPEAGQQMTDLATKWFINKFELRTRLLTKA